MIDFITDFALDGLEKLPPDGAIYMYSNIMKRLIAAARHRNELATENERIRAELDARRASPYCGTPSTDAGERKTMTKIEPAEKLCKHEPPERWHYSSDKSAFLCWHCSAVMLRIDRRNDRRDVARAVFDLFEAELDSGRGYEDVLDLIEHKIASGAFDGGDNGS